jgi:hypothetical protein
LFQGSVGSLKKGILKEMANIKIKAVLFCIVLVCSGLSGTVYAQEAEVQKREYLSENGRKIKITSMGNLIGLETPMGFGHIDNHEGYVLAYDDPYDGTTRVLHDVFDSQSMSIKPGLPDFVPVSFEGPPSGTSFEINTLVSATAVVDTRDGLLRLTHQFTWRAGTGTVNVKTTITNLAAVSVYLRSHKHHGNINLDSHGDFGAAGRLNSVITDPNLRAIAVYNKTDRCDPPPITLIGCDYQIVFPDCPVPPPPPFCTVSPSILLTRRSVSRHLLQMSGSPLPTRATVGRAGDVLELRSAAPGTSLSDTREPGDYQQTLVWSVNQRLDAGASRSFTTTYQVN